MSRTWNYWMKDEKRWIGGWSVGPVAVFLATLCVGCSGGQKPAPTGAGESTGGGAGQPRGEHQAAVDSQPSAAGGQAAAPVAPPSIPKVYLTEEQRKSSRVRVGDLVPDATLPDLSGKTHSIRGLFGKRLTVLVFFHAGGMVDSMRSKELLQDLDRDVIAAQGKKGVAVIAVDVRDRPEKVKSLVQEAPVGYPVLLDTDGAYFAKLASGVFPRIYALDPDGKVLWFDLEYSTTTRYSLKQTIFSVLRESPQGF
jgi:peroxiredoxin